MADRRRLRTIVEKLAAEYGRPVAGDGLLRLPLVYQQETLGELRLAPRGPGEPFALASATSAISRRGYSLCGRQVHRFLRPSAIAAANPGVAVILGHAGFPVQRPFLANSEALFRELRPGARALKRSAPDLAGAVTVDARGTFSASG